MAEQEGPELTSSHGHTEIMATSVELTMKMTQRLAAETFHTVNLQRGHIRKGAEMPLGNESLLRLSINITITRNKEEHDLLCT